MLAASAGNHAQGVALSARKLGVKATIVMPVTTPEIKINAVKALGAKIVLHGDGYSECAEEAARLVRETGITFIPPYDDPQVIAGQGTVAKEILEALAGRRLDAIFVPIGGAASPRASANTSRPCGPRSRWSAWSPRTATACTAPSGPASA